MANDVYGGKLTCCSQGGREVSDFISFIKKNATNKPVVVAEEEKKKKKKKELQAPGPSYYYQLLL